MDYQGVLQDVMHAPTITHLFSGNLRYADWICPDTGDDMPKAHE